MYDTSLITSEVCIRCGACCSAYVRKDTLELVLVNEFEQEQDVEVVSCRHLRTAEGQHVCGNYENRPAVCRAFNCLADANRKGVEIGPDTALGSRVRQAVQEIHGRGIEL